MALLLLQVKMKNFLFTTVSVLWHRHVSFLVLLLVCIFRIETQIPIYGFLITVIINGTFISFTQ